MSSTNLDMACDEGYHSECEFNYPDETENYNEKQTSAHQLIRVFPLMNTAEGTFVICRSLVQVHSNGSCLRILFHRFKTIFDRIKTVYCRKEESTNAIQNIAVNKAKAMKSRTNVGIREAKRKTRFPQEAHGRWK